MTAWLTVEQAAARVERSTDTIYRWGRQQQLLIAGGLVHEGQLLAVDQEKRRSRGRPRALTDLERRTAPILLDGQELGTVTVNVKHGTIVRVDITDDRVLAAIRHANEA